jgi:hypothetical protein
MKHIATHLLMTFVLGALSVNAEQKIEYGSKGEMRGADVVYVDTGTNIEFRENVVTLLARDLPEVKASDRLDESVELILQFVIASAGDRKGAARLLVLGRPLESDSVRILARYEDSKGSIWTPKLSTVLVRRFVRDYRAANPPAAVTN